MKMISKKNDYKKSIESIDEYLCSVRLTVNTRKRIIFYDPIYELYRPLVYKSLNSTCDDSQSLYILGNSPNDAVKKWNSFCLGPINGLSYHK